jgi:hypothetical protein
MDSLHGLCISRPLCSMLHMKPHISAFLYTIHEQLFCDNSCIRNYRKFVRWIVSRFGYADQACLLIPDFLGVLC